MSKTIYEIRHRNKIAADIDETGHSRIYCGDFLPYNPIGLHKLMDFNQAFHSYDHIEGANCQTAFRSGVTQSEAAVLAVKEVGLNQIKEVKGEVFAELPQYYKMFCRRLELLRAAEG